MLPVTIIGGYLGSGKTTLVNHLLRNAGGLRLAVLVNEFGELPIDADLIEAQDDDIISIEGGCVCCSFGNDLTAALQDMAAMQPPPDHVIVESSGVAIPGAIVGAISLMMGFRNDGIVVVADAETVQKAATDKYMGDTVLRQISDADIILLNKTDLVSADASGETQGWLRQKNPEVSIVPCVQSAASPAMVLGSHLGRSHTPGPHHEATGLDMLTLVPLPGGDAVILARALATGGHGVIRAKGFMTGADGSKRLIQVVGQRWDVTEAGPERRDGVVCLGFKGQLDRDALHALSRASSIP